MCVHGLKCVTTYSFDSTQALVVQCFAATNAVPLEREAQRGNGGHSLLCLRVHRGAGHNQLHGQSGKQYHRNAKARKRMFSFFVLFHFECWCLIESRLT